jgi:replication factor C small subunit|tara:strand:- start:210 stop:1064 length:855 start_codon:yes stop_codon:yes gene_type:complete
MIGMWIEKYRPKTMKDVVGHMELRPIWEKWVNEKDLPHVILAGQQGIGKTTIAIALARDILGDGFDLNFLELNASDDRKLDVVRTKIKDFATTRKLGVSCKICLLDEMENMTKDAQKALKRIMEKYASNVRFIITTNHLHQIIAPIQSRCVVQKLKPVDKYAIRGLIFKICQSENLDYDYDVETDNCGGDVRKAISMLENGIKSENRFDYRKVLSMNRYQMMNTLQEEVKNSSIAEVCRGLHDAVIESDIEDKFKYLRVIGELEYRSPIMTPRIGISWLVSQLN